METQNENLAVILLGLTASVLILLVNLSLLWFILYKAKHTMINMLIALDCLMALLTIPMTMNAGWAGHIFHCTHLLPCVFCANILVESANPVQMQRPAGAPVDTMLTDHFPLIS